MERCGARTRRDMVPPTVTIPAEIQALDLDTVLARLEILRQNARARSRRAGSVCCSAATREPRSSRSVVLAGR